MSLQCRICRSVAVENLTIPPGAHDWIVKCHCCQALFLLPKEPHYPTMESLKKAFAYAEPIPGHEYDIHRFD